MILGLFQKKPRRDPLELQLTAMIDVFSMIVIFLIFGTVFGASDMVVPNGMHVPKSISKEGIESAARVSITESGVTLNLIERSVPLSVFREGAERQAFLDEARPIVEAQMKKTGSLEQPLNLLADQGTPYRDIFDVVATFRELGFTSILFVATGGK